MKKIQLFAIIIFCCLGVHAQEANDTLVSLAKVNLENLEEFIGWSQFDDSEKELVEAIEEGLAITVTRLQDQSWQPQVMVVPDGSFDLEEGHNYVVRLTIKVPSDGSYYVNIGTWQANGFAYAPATASDTFQIIDVDYPEYKGKVIGAHVLVGFGWVPGTTIIKEVEVFEKTSTAAIRSVNSARDVNDTIYNLSGQKVSSSYKGIVIRKRKLLVK